MSDRRAQERCISADNQHCHDQDIDFTPDGLVVALRRSKTDQQGEGRKVGVPYGSRPATCPVRTLQAWLEASGIAEGPVFRSVKGGRTSSRGGVAVEARAWAGGRVESSRQRASQHDILARVFLLVISQSSGTISKVMLMRSSSLPDGITR